MKNVSVKRPRGRPATGRDPVTAIRLAPDLLSAIDKQVAATGAESRAAAIREILTGYLKRKGLF
jgi:Ribbon-helix-helix protein, copG family